MKDIRIRKFNRARLISISAVLIVAAALLAWRIWGSRQSFVQLYDSQDRGRDSSSDALQGWKEHADSQFHFILSYPPSLTMKEYDEGGGAVTLDFENLESLDGFQLFIVPYQGEKVSDERFHMDIPSGVRKEVEDIVIDGAKGAAFVSYDASLGETREVWIVHGGYLYELTTPRATEMTLEKVLTTFKFTQ